MKYENEMWKLKKQYRVKWDVFPRGSEAISVIREITRGNVMCGYLTTNDLI